MSPWGWSPERPEGIWRYGARWMRPFVAAAPWLTVLLLLLMLHMIGGTFTLARGVLFDLPDAGLADGETTGLAAILMPMPHETLLFFDDARYMLGDAASVTAFGEHLAQRMEQTGDRTLLVLADRRVAGGELMRLAGVARRNGAEKLLFAEKKAEVAE